MDTSRVMMMPNNVIENMAANEINNQQKNRIDYYPIR